MTDEERFTKEVESGIVRMQEFLRVQQETTYKFDRTLALLAYEQVTVVTVLAWELRRKLAIQEFWRKEEQAAFKRT